MPKNKGKSNAYPLLLPSSNRGLQFENKEESKIFKLLSLGLSCESKY